MSKLTIKKNQYFIDDKPCQFPVCGIKVNAVAGEHPEAILYCIFDEIEVETETIEEYPVKFTVKNGLEMDWKCKNCKNWEREENESQFIPSSFGVGCCNKEPFQTTSMKSNEMAMLCGHDGPIFTGEDFGCVNFEPVENTLNPVKKG